MNQRQSFPRLRPNFSANENNSGRGYDGNRNSWREARPNRPSLHHYQRQHKDVRMIRPNLQMDQTNINLQRYGKQFGQDQARNISQQNNNNFFDMKQQSNRSHSPNHQTQQTDLFRSFLGSREHESNIRFQSQHKTSNAAQQFQNVMTDPRQQSLNMNQSPREIGTNMPFHNQDFASNPMQNHHNTPMTGLQQQPNFNTQQVSPFACFPPPMQNLNIPAPCFSWPPPMMPVPNVQIERKQKQNQQDDKVDDEDKKLVREWLKQRNLYKKDNQNSTTESNVKINVAKRMITEYVTGIDDLIAHKNILCDNLETNEYEWSQVVAKSREIKKRLQDLEFILFKKGFMGKLQVEVKKRQKKRERQRKLRQLNAKDKQEKLRKAVVWDQQIDEWRHKIVSDIHSKKLTDSLKSDAGKSLIEVRKKKSESSKYMEKLSGMKELRSIRRETALQRGIFIFGKEDEKFENKVDGLIKLMKSRISDYKDEEKTLLVMLEEEKDQIQREDDKKRKRLMKNEHVRLFGYDPALESRRYWCQAEENPISLVQVRRLWDVYIVPGSIPGASLVPDGWVEPEPGANRNWNNYLYKKKMDGS